jgi:hypothetical protein
MRLIVLAADFLDDNYLSNEARVPVTLLQTNACSPLATNAIGGNIWDNFSSQSYKDLPSVGDITWYHPYTGEAQTYVPPADAPHASRPLVSLWSTAPYLLNNTVGHFEVSRRSRRGCGRFRTASNRCCGPRSAEGRTARRQDSRQDPIGAAAPYLRCRRIFDFLEASEPLLPRSSAAAARDRPIRPARRSACSLNATSYEGPDWSQRLPHDGKVVDLIMVAKDTAALPRNATDEQARAVFKVVDPLLGVARPISSSTRHLFGTDWRTRTNLRSSSSEDVLGKRTIKR